MSNSNPSNSKNYFDDENLWLEEIEGKDALDWVKTLNQKSLKLLAENKNYQKIFDQIYAYLTDEEKIAFGFIQNGDVINFWQDKKNIRGIYRKATLESYIKNQPRWEIFLNIDELAGKEGKNWVAKGIKYLFEDPQICLINLSDGGKDTSVYREFNIAKKAFVPKGFEIPESKTKPEWLDENTLIVPDGTDKESLSDSGYPLKIKLLKRGEQLKNSPIIYEGEKSDVVAGSMVFYHENKKIVLIYRAIAFFSSEYFILQNDLKTLRKLPLPLKSYVLGIFKAKILFSIHEDWNYKGTLYKSGGVLALDEKEEITVLFNPTERMAFCDLQITKDFIYINYLEDVIKKTKRFSFQKGWTESELELPINNSFFEMISTTPKRNDFFITIESFLNPPSLYYFDAEKNKFTLITKTKLWFDSKSLITKQFFVPSKDGTQIPYFIVHHKDMKFNGSNPTLLYGYGGFENPMLPNYNSPLGMVWLSKGGVYVLANIRGGGEFGPTWHQSALKENRQRSFDDFHAIAEDLHKRRITSPPKLAIKGGSNGGLLVSAAFTQRPELYGAVISQVPITDMMRYHKLLAGASWMAEYGNPDVENERDFLIKYSPYHNIQPDKKYPKIFYLTSTKDDRVHPAHARKMVKKLLDHHYDVLYFENTDGGHGMAANLLERAKMAALEFSFLYEVFGF